MQNRNIGLRLPEPMPESSQKIKIALTFLLYLFCAGSLWAQHEHMGSDMNKIDIPNMFNTQDMQGLLGPYKMTREASGTSWQPDSTPEEGNHWMSKNWAFMLEGYVDAIYDDQRGKRGDEKTFSESMLMFMAEKKLKKGKLGFHTMFSLDPLMGKDGYPLLLQTGETSDGSSPLIDRQHPHDLFMELATTMSFPMSDNSALFTYIGLPGEPALGPPTFMHRFSGMSIPSAPITHHWLDSTHITFGVATVGYIYKKIKIEGSVFNGREPDQNRWDIETRKFDSGSLRLSFNPTDQWAMQVSFGYIDSPEQLHPDVSVRRTTASIIYNKAFKNSNWQTTLAWGQNNNHPGKTLDGLLIESTVCFKETHTLFSRLERVKKDELFPEGDPLYGESFIVNKATLGYIFDFPAIKHIKLGIGTSLDINIIPKQCKPSYGNEPLGYMVFIRAKIV